MALQSQLFRNDPKLEAAATSDPAHILPGATGPHVTKIQQALNQIDGAKIDFDGVYGNQTATAVLAFKRKRNIINRNFQTQPDNIVGKMTITALDKEVLAQEQPLPDRRTCILFQATPVDVAAPTFRLGITQTSGDIVGAGNDADKMAAAFRASRATLRSARDKLFDLANAIRDKKQLTPGLTRIFNIAAKWLNLDPSNKDAAVPHLDKASELMLRNINLKTSTGTDVQLTRVSANFHAQSTTNSPDLGLRCGTPFFSPDGPNCRRDVVTHEFFHMVGVAHGGGGLNDPTIRSAITTPAQALNSADNLAQLVAELETPGGKTDACARGGE
ncbi:MAG: peptidoglycan-binding domain-containing protein [Ferruginibacter sp.]